MQFNSYVFILLFLPALVVGYFTFNKIHSRIGKLYLMTSGVVFYAYGGWKLTAILLLSILINYLSSFLINHFNQFKKPLLILSVLFNIFMLFYFKYSNFFFQTLSGILEYSFSFKEIVLPLGISFFTFQQIMYVVNIYNGNIKDVNFLDYLLYILYFPKLIMGPLAEPKNLIFQFNDIEKKSVNWDNLANGIKVFSFGLFKKMILADTFATAVTWGFSNIDSSTSMDWFLIMLSYTFQIYFDFSGYSDMAIGISKMLNIDLPINFDSPYKALSIRDFWKRWHISLTGFFTRYIYFPLGGSRKGKFRTYLNTMIIFLISGLWHGANWTFVLWGILHGFLSIVDRFIDDSIKNVSEVVRWASTFFTVNILWLLFRSETITQWWFLIKKMFKFQDTSVSEGLVNSFVLPETSFIFRVLQLENVNSSIRGFSLLIFIIVAYVICLIPNNNFRKMEENNWFMMILASIALVWSFLGLSSESVFVYFNF